MAAVTKQHSWLSVSFLKCNGRLVHSVANPVLAGLFFLVRAGFKWLETRIKYFLLKSKTVDADMPSQAKPPGGFPNGRSAFQRQTPPDRQGHSTFHQDHSGVPRTLASTSSTHLNLRRTTCRPLLCELLFSSDFLPIV
jgi:hypothetical protein